MSRSVSFLFGPPNFSDASGAGANVDSAASTVTVSPPKSTSPTIGIQSSNIAKTWKKPRVIGKGSFSTVFYLRGKAIKLVSVRYSQMLEREYDLLKRLEGCRNIVHALKISHREGKDSFLVMDYGGKDVFDALPHFSAEDKMFTYLQVSHALEYMHERDVVHLDIKMENVVIDAIRRVRVIDFGLARHLSKEERDTRTIDGVVGSRSYCCPEMLGSKQFNGFEADSWSMGIFVFVLWHNCMMWRTAAIDVDPRFARFEKDTASMSPSSYFQQCGHCCTSSTPEWVWAVVDAALVVNPARRQRRWSIGVGGTDVTWTNSLSTYTFSPQGPHDKMDAVFQWLQQKMEWCGTIGRRA